MEVSEQYIRDPGNTCATGTTVALAVPITVTGGALTSPLTLSPRLCADGTIPYFDTDLTLSPGSYQVTITPPAGWVLTTLDSFTVEVVASPNVQDILWVGLRPWKLGDATITANGITIKTTARLAGAIDSLRWNGIEFVDSTDHGRQFQTAWAANGQGQCYNPTEAGSSDDWIGFNTTSQILTLTQTANSIQSTNHPAFWVAPAVYDAGCNFDPAYPGYWRGANSANQALTSKATLRKTVTIGHAGIPNVIEYVSDITLSADELAQLPHKYIMLVNPAAVLPDTFSRAYQFDPPSDTLTELTQASTPGYGLFVSTPLITTTQNNAYALGIYTDEIPRGGFLGNEQYRISGYGFENYSQAGVTLLTTRTPKTPPTGEYFTAGTYSYRSFLVVGTLQDVTSAMRQLHALHPPPPPAIAGNIYGLNCGIPAGQTQCQTTLHWTTQKTGGGYVYERDTRYVASTLDGTGSTPVTVTASGATFDLYQNGSNKLLSSVFVRGGTGQISAPNCVIPEGQTTCQTTLTWTTTDTGPGYVYQRDVKRLASTIDGTQSQSVDVTAAGAYYDLYQSGNALLNSVFVKGIVSPVINQGGLNKTYSPWAVWLKGSRFSSSMKVQLTDNGVRWGADITATVAADLSVATFQLPAKQAPSGCNVGTTCAIQIVLINNQTGDASAPFSLTLDAVPEKPSAVVTLPVSSDTIHLSWSGAAEQVSAFTIYRGGVPVGTTKENFFTDRGLSPSKSYNYTVTSMDSAGSESDASAPATETTMANVPPVFASAPPLPFSQIRSVTWYDFGVPNAAQEYANLQAAIPRMGCVRFPGVNS